MSKDLFAVMKSAPWASEVAKHGLYLDPVYEHKNSPDNAPVVGYAVDQPDGLIYLQQGMKLMVPLEELKALAFANLRRRLSAIDWREMDFPTESGPLKVLVLAGDEYAAEGLLLEERMREAAAKLGASRVLACTPGRGLLLVMSFDVLDENHVGVFLGVCHDPATSEGHETLSTLVWEVSGGQIQDVLRVRES